MQYYLLSSSTGCFRRDCSISLIHTVFAQLILLCNIHECGQSGSTLCFVRERITYCKLDSSSMIRLLQKRCQPLMASFDLLAALDTSLSRAGRTDVACILSAVLCAKGAPQFSSLPQFTSSEGGPVFTAGHWPIERSQANAFNNQGNASSAGASESSSWSDPDEKAESLLDQVQQAALSHVVGSTSES